MSQDSSADPGQPPPGDPPSGDPAPGDPAPGDPAPGDPPPGDPPPPPAPPPQRRRNWLTITLLTAAAAAVVCAGGGYLLVNSLREDLPEAGECMTDAPDPNEMSVVGCDSDQAAWSVVGADGAMTQVEFQALTPEDQVCQEHEGTEQALWVTDAWFVDDDTEGTVVCLRRAGEGAEEPRAPEPAESGQG